LCIVSPQAAQGILTLKPRIYDLEQILKKKDEKHANVMAEVVKDATTSYEKLE
jgi:hypothetical protein